MQSMGGPAAPCRSYLSPASAVILPWPFPPHLGSHAGPRSSSIPASSTSSPIPDARLQALVRRATADRPPGRSAARARTGARTPLALPRMTRARSRAARATDVAAVPGVILPGADHGRRGSHGIPGALGHCPASHAGSSAATVSGASVARDPDARGRVLPEMRDQRRDVTSRARAAAAPKSGSRRA